jgi:hypothetical protein
MNGCNSYVVPIIVPDPCDGDKKSTKCVIDENAFIELNLPANSTQEAINGAMYQALQAQALINEAQQKQIDALEGASCCDDIATIQSDLTDLQTQVNNIQPAVKGVQVLVTQAQILNSGGFSKVLVTSTTGKVLVPVSISAYRKSGGTAYSIANSIRLTSVAGSSSGTVGSGSLDAAFTNGTESTTIAPVSTTNFSLIPGNSLHVVSGSFLAPSTITGGTGDIIIFLTYTEIII